MATVASPTVGFDHVLHWVPDLDAAVAAFADRGFPLTYGGRHPGGTRNAVRFARESGAYVEVLTFEGWRDRPREGDPQLTPRIRALLDAGGGASHFALTVEDLADAVPMLRARGIPVGDPQTGTTRRGDGEAVTWQIAHLADGPAWRPFLIDYGLAPAQRRAALAALGVPFHNFAIERLILAVAEPERGAIWLAGVLGLPVEQAGDPVVVRVPGCTIHLRRGEGERIVGVGLSGPGAAEGIVCGVRYERLW